MNETSGARAGLTVAIITQVIWGVLPWWGSLYHNTPAIHLFVWRVLLCAVATTIFLFATKQQGALIALLRAPKRWPPYLLATLLLGANWLGFFVALELGHVLEISFATYLLPLLSIGMGVVFLSEKLTKWTALGLAAAALGVGAMCLSSDGPPWLGLLLAFAFAAYTIIRKLNPVAPAVGLTFEVWIMAAFVMGYVLFGPDRSIFAQADGFAHTAWLMTFGPQTALTMLMFNFSSQRLKLSTTGVLQFLSPTITFLIAMLAGDPMTTGKMIGFILIWAGVGFYIIDALRARSLHRTQMAETIASADIR